MIQRYSLGSSLFLPLCCAFHIFFFYSQIQATMETLTTKLRIGAYNFLSQAGPEPSIESIGKNSNSFGFIHPDLYRSLTNKVFLSILLTLRRSRISRLWLNKIEGYLFYSFHFFFLKEYKGQDYFSITLFTEKNLHQRPTNTTSN